jgi:TRAP transporter TAXI family solute receptor
MKLIAKLQSAAFAAALTALSAAPVSADMGRTTIGTNPQGTMYYIVGGGLAKLISDEFAINATAQPYAGSSVYLPLVNSGEVTLGVSSSLDGGQSFNGEGAYQEIGAQDKLRTLARLWPLPYAYFARADSGMKTIADLKGKKVAVTLGANQALKQANEAMLRAGGIDPETDIEAITISGLPEGYDLVSSGSIAASATALGIPLARKMDATVPEGIVMLAITGDNATSQFVSDQMSGLYIIETNPGENNPGVSAPQSVLGFDVFLLASTDVSDEDAYRLVKTLHTNWAALQTDYGVLRSNPAESLSLSTNTVPYHDGAKRFFEEAGLWSGENDARESEFAKP